ncbi:SCO family protein [Bacillaceae bacterium]
MGKRNFAVFCALLCAAFIAALTGCSGGTEDEGKTNHPGAEEQALNWKVEDFSYVDHNGQKFGLADLQGKVWLADFIFTNCETVCPPMTAHMAKLQKRLQAEKLPVEFVSFSVDPARDKPEVLQAFAKKFNADLTNWHFLTGYSQEEIERFAKENFKTLVQMSENSDQVMHGTSFYLVDQSGTVVKKYDGLQNQEETDEQIVRDIRSLLE